MSKSHHTRKENKFRSLIREYSFELTVAGLFGMGVFLLVEKMQIKSYIAHIILSIVRWVAGIFSIIIAFLMENLKDIEVSDIVGILLIFSAIVLVYLRIRFRIIQRYSYLSECPECGGDLRRIHRNYQQKFLGLILMARYKNYSCKKCSFKGFRIGLNNK